jgi:hypothetical protein
MAVQKVLPFPPHYPEPLSHEINREVRLSSEFHFSVRPPELCLTFKTQCGGELKVAFCDLLSLDTVA